MDKHVQKNGAGAHSWGAIQDELELELAAQYDESLDAEEVANPSAYVGDEKDAEGPRPTPVRRNTSDISEEEREQARQIRAKAAKGEGASLHSAHWSRSANFAFSLQSTSRP